MHRRVLLIGDMERTAIKNLMFYAENNKLSYDKMKKIMARKMPPPGDNEKYVITIPLNFRIVFTIEQHPGGWFKHLSVSIPNKNKAPHPNAVEMIMAEFEMGDLNARPGNSVYIEEIGNGYKAINILCPFEYSNIC